MNEFQSFLDKSLSKVSISELVRHEDSHPDYDIYKEIRKLIIQERKAQKLTQQQLALRTGLSQANISNIEKGNSHPTIDSLKKISDALGKRLIIEFADREELNEWL